MSNQWLVITDVDAVQRWLFAPIRLRVIAGGSQALTEFDAAIAKMGARDTPFAAGGSSLTMWDSDTAARQFVDQARAKLAELAPGAHLSASVPVQFSGTDFGGTLQAALRSLEANKRAGHSASEPAWAAWAKPCEGCGIEPAGERISRSDEAGEWFGPSCAVRWGNRDRQTWIREYCAAVETPTPALSFEQLANREGTGAATDVALVAADVDGVGERLKGFDSLQDYADFSRDLKNGLRDAMQAAVTAVLAGHRAKDPLPLEILFEGGDDLLVAIRGDLALPFVQELTDTFSQNRLGLGISAAVVVANVHFPFRLAHDVAERLLLNAKREARESRWASGAVDYAIVSESMADPEEILADRRIARDRDEIILTWRPYQVGQGDRSLDSLRNACKELMKPVGDAPPIGRTQLFDLRQLSSRATFPAGATSSMSDAKAHLKHTMAQFKRRVGRREASKAAWATVEQIMGTDVTVASTTTTRCAAGDLADALGLWGI